MPFPYLSLDYKLFMLGWLIAGVWSFWFLLSRRRRWKNSPGRLKLVHGLFSLWMFLAAFTVVELYFALIFDSTDSFNMTKVSQKWFEKYVKPEQKDLVFQSGEITRYRDNREFPKALPPEKHHICFIGDSFTYGHGIPRVEDRFSNRVGALLDEDRPGKFVISNLADAGRDTHWVEVVLQNLIKSDYRVDTFVYVLCLNDIETFHPRHRTYYDDLFSHGPSFPLIGESYFLSFAYFRTKLIFVPDVQNYYSFVKEYYEGDPWQRMRSKLDDIHRLCEQNEIDFRIMVFPFLHTLGPEYGFHQPHKQLAAYGEKAGIPLLDLEPVLAPHVEEGLTVNPFDAHPNERAHRLAAEAIRNRLLNDLVEPARE